MKKDLDWLVQRIHSEREQLSQSWLESKETDVDSVFNDGRDDALSNVLRLIDQLDEPEVLSQEWINEHSNGASRSQYVWVDDLKEFLVPKQEITGEQFINYAMDNDLIVFEKEALEDRDENIIEKYTKNKVVTEKSVIPKFVAEYIDDRKEVGFTIYQAIRIVRENSRFKHSRLREWLRTNKGQEAFARAWLDGYEVEEELLYRLKAGKNYLYFKNDGSVQTVTKKNATINKERLEKLPFDLEQALDSGIIELEELEE